MAAASVLGLVRVDERAGVAEHFGQRRRDWRRRPARRASSPRAPACRSLPRTTAARAAARLRTARGARRGRRSRCGATTPVERRPGDAVEPGPRRRRSPCPRAPASGHGRRRPAPMQQSLVRVEQRRRRSCAARGCRRTARSRRPATPRRAAASRARPAGRPRCGRGGTSSSRSTSPAVNADGTMIAIGAARVRAGERRVVAPDFGARALGVRQEVEIVNRDDLGRVRARAAAADAASG